MPTQIKWAGYKRERLPDTQEVIYTAAVKLFWERGFHATSMRSIANTAGIQAASIYHHFASKDAILFDVMKNFFDTLIGEMNRALAVTENPTESLRAAMALHVRFHAEHAMEAVVADTEMRALKGDFLSRVLAVRDEYEQIFQNILSKGVETGEFIISDIKIACYMLLAMGTGVVFWFQPDGRLTLDEVIDEYVSAALKQVCKSVPVQ